METESPKKSIEDKRRDPTIQQSATSRDRPAGARAGKDLATIKHELKEMIIQVSGMGQLTPADIDDHASFFQDGLGLDSIDVLEFVVRLDKTYGLKIENDDKGQAILTDVSSVAHALREGGFC